MTIILTKTAVEEKYFKLFDIQDEDDMRIVTLDGGRKWLADFWDNNPDDDMSDDEHKEWIETILKADEKKLFDYLSGIDYSIEDYEGNQCVEEINITR